MYVEMLLKKMEHDIKELKKDNLMNDSLKLYIQEQTYSELKELVDKVSKDDRYSRI